LSLKRKILSQKNFNPDMFYCHEKKALNNFLYANYNFFLYCEFEEKYIFLMIPFQRIKSFWT